MSPESIESHNKVKTAVTAAVFNIVERRNLGEVYSDRTLLTHPGAGFSTEPDLCFATWETLTSRRLRFKPRAQRVEEAKELVGTPDLVVEIVSDSSVHKDLRSLRGAYARAGIPEYWLIDARASRIEFTVLRLTSGKYSPGAPVGRPQPSRVLGAKFRLTRAKNPAGNWTYRLTTVR